MSEIKTKQTKATVEQYIETLPNDRKKAEAREIVEVIKEITDRVPAMWGPSIIGFDRQKYKHGEMPMLAFSPRKQRMVFYVINETEQQQKLLENLGKHSTGKVCLYINKLADVDRGVLRQILENSWNRAQEKNRSK